MSKKIVATSLLVLIIAIIFVLIGNFKTLINRETPPPIYKKEAGLEIVSTAPDPLEGATILPTQNIGINFNKPLYRSEFKHKFDPEIEHEVEVVDGIDKELGSTFRIKFSQPLELGSGYTLFILPNTKTEDGFELGQEKIYHFKTIRY